MSGGVLFESAAWEGVPGGWRPLYGSFARQGFSIEWHDFEIGEGLDWARSFHPKSLEICLNLSGCGSVGAGASRVLFRPRTAGHYVATDEILPADRHAAQRHRFLTIELSADWIARELSGREADFVPSVRGFLNGKATPVATVGPLSERLASLVDQTRHPTLEGPALWLWVHAKVLEAVAETLMARSAIEMFCDRQTRLARERVERVKAILAAQLEYPPTLAELGKLVGCSPFYLSRTFTEQSGMTITRYLRRIRMERAAEMLRSGRHNVTETALAVGYSSLSHFSKVFAETYQVCPCVFPLRPADPPSS